MEIVDQAPIHPYADTLKTFGKKTFAALVAQAALLSGPSTAATMKSTAAEFGQGPNVLPTKIVDLDVTMVDAGTGGAQKYTKDHVMTVLDEADTAINVATAGSVKFGDITVDSTTLRPQGKTTSTTRKPSEQCYTDGQLLELGRLREERRKQQLGTHAMTLLVLNERSSCTPAGGAAFMGTDISYYNQLYPKVVPHELGHNWGNGHQLMVDCTVPERREHGEEGWRYRFFHAEPIQASITNGCGLRYHLDGEVDNYASIKSVMGSGDVSLLRQFYLPHELHRIYPGRFHMMELSPDAPYGKYYLSMSEGGIGGVKIPLKAKNPLDGEHVLNQMEQLPDSERITHIAFELQYSEQDRHAEGPIDITNPYADAAIYPVALGQTQSYRIDTQLFGRLPDYPLACYDGEPRRSPPSYIVEPIVYIDSQLDIIVSIGRDGAQPYVLVQKPSESREKLAQLQKEVAYRNKLIFTEQ